MPIELTVSLISATSALCVVFLTHFLSRQVHKKQFRSQYLADSLADLFQHYLRFCSDSCDENRSLLLTSVERCRLYCSKRFLTVLDQFETLLLYDHPDVKALGNSFSELRRLSRQETHR